MALKPTIFKFKIALSDMDRNNYDTLQLTLAQHPSETVERMMVRLLAYCINVEEHLVFTKGLSSPEEADISSNTLDGQVQTWIDVGEPASIRIKKASRIAKNVKVYSFNSKSDVWWKQEQEHLSKLPIEVYQFPWQQIQTLAGLVQRTMELSLTISESTGFFSTDNGDCEVSWRALQN